MSLPNPLALATADTDNSVPKAAVPGAATAPVNGKPPAPAAPAAVAATTNEAEQIAECTPTDDPEADKLLHMHSALGALLSCRTPLWLDIPRSDCMIAH